MKRKKFVAIGVGIALTLAIGAGVYIGKYHTPNFVKEMKPIYTCKAKELKIYEGDSVQRKRYITAYNLCTRGFNSRGLIKQRFEIMMNEAKWHTKDNFELITLRTDIKAMGEPKSKIQKSILSSFKSILKECKDCKPCSKKEDKGITKIDEEEQQRSVDMWKDLYALIHSDNNIKSFTKEYLQETTGTNIAFVRLNMKKIESKGKGAKLGDGLNGEDLLKIDYHNILSEGWTKQKDCLDKMREQIDKIK